MIYELEDLQNKTALITGASSGIGAACAEFLASKGCKLILLARRKDRLEVLKKKLDVQVELVEGDINQESTLLKMEKAALFNVDIFINNAGLAIGKDHFDKVKDRDLDLVLSTNVNSAFKIAKRVLSHMKQNQKGDIINICSIASHEAYAGGVVYCASKHALLALGKALREETYGQNIRIINISPGMVETEFSLVRFSGDKEKAKSAYTGMIPLKASDIAYQIVNALETPRHVNLDEIIILATDQAGATKRV